MKPPYVRIRTAYERKKALAQLQELRLSGQVGQALVIIQRLDGDIEVLSQELKPYELPRLLYAATMALQHAEKNRIEPKPEPHEMPLAWAGTVNEGDRIRPKITTDAEGIMQPPPGESIISCGTCRHPRYYVCVGEDGRDTAGLPVRLACAHCRAEVSFDRDAWEAP